MSHLGAFWLLLLAACFDPEGPPEACFSPPDFAVYAADPSRSTVELQDAEFAWGGNGLFVHYVDETGRVVSVQYEVVGQRFRE